MENKATKRTNRLGRGLSALIPDISTEIDKKDIITIDLKNIYPNQDQPRRVFDEEKIKILSESIKNYGVLQPIVLKPDDKGKYMIIAGERRYRASKLARKSDIPAVIKDIPMKDIMEIALIENLQREELNPIEEALAYRSLIKNYEVTQEEISEAVGKSRPHITNTLRLLNLPQKIMDMIDQGQITAGHGKALLRVNDENLQLELANKVIAEELSVRATEALAKKICEDNIKEVPKKSKEKDVFFIGRGSDYNVALEGSLKLKEISYIHSEAYASGELKHGPIALIEKGITVISILTDKNLLEKSISNIEEVITRGAKTFIVTNQDIENSNFDNVVKIEDTNPLLSPILSVIPLQLLAYYISKDKGLDVDKPRNLAKSVTVE